MIVGNLIEVRRISVDGRETLNNLCTLHDPPFWRTFASIKGISDNGKTCCGLNLDSNKMSF